MVRTAIVLHGKTSAGKSSLARALQDGSDVPVFHVSLDAFVEMSRRRDMRTEDELNQALSIYHHNLASTLTRINESHFNIVLDLVLRDESAISACLDASSGRPTFVIGVFCPLEVLEERERNRSDRGNGMARSQFGHPAYDREYSMKIDTSKVTPEEGARMIWDFVRTQIAPNTAVNTDSLTASRLP
ncbi:chloramphenicol phosphotransferase CPT family protein [Noviherbaspirillum sp.]|jgi:chloramphenicol 3-O phosphotransferase|uniref:chloramphenicol phosphotransferase CPT family protein n=1 Tax=Noviherbaspirillum sp. TaxID=1926288 RepID=UPI0039C9ED3A